MSSLSIGKPFYEVIQPIYFDDLDMLQILHNARYFLLVERAIGFFWMKIGWGSSFHEILKIPDMSHLVRSNHIDYHRPVAGTGEVRVRLWVQKLGVTSLTFGFAILHSEEEWDYATGTRTLVRVDSNTKKPFPWTERLRQNVAPFIGERGL